MFWSYPIKIKAGRVFNDHCEINVAEHCNLSCKSCSHQSPIMAKRFVDPAQVYHDLKLLEPVYHARRVSLLGGEPLLHPDLLSVIKAARSSGVADGVRVVTNGVLLHRMSAECWRELDEIRVSVYPGYELAPDPLDFCQRMAEEHQVALRFEPTPTFFESYAARGTQDQRLVRQIYATCTIAHDWRCQLIADGYFYKCPHSYFLARSLALSNPAQPVDGLRISGEKSFRKQLLAYLKSPEPLQACTYCLGTVGKRFAHQQLQRKDWPAPQECSTEDLLDIQQLAKAKRYLRA